MFISPVYTICLVPVPLALLYVVYYHLLHPLARFPGPFTASLSNLWKFLQIFNDRFPSTLQRLHSKYQSDVIRVGPTSLHFSHPDAIAQIYKRGWSKSDYYKGFEAPGATGIFNETDEPFHGRKKRMLSPVFSMKSLREMEDLMDSRYAILRHQLDRFSETGQTFDLKRYITYCIADVLGELAFGKAFGCQEAEDPSHIPPISAILYVGAVKGSFPKFAGIGQKLLAPWIRNDQKSLRVVNEMAAERIAERVSIQTDRVDMLGRILEAREEKTGEAQSAETVQEIAAELIVGGTHSTGNALHFILANLSRNSEVLQRCIKEIDEKLPPLEPGQPAYGVTGLIEQLDFVNVAIRESFRKNPGTTFDMPRVVPSGGAEIVGYQIPAGTIVSANLLTIGHNEAIWGPDVNEYNPDRWYRSDTKDLGHFVTPWSVGKRSCVGQNFAQLNIVKMLATLLRCYEFDFINKDEPITTNAHGSTALRNSILVKAKRRGDIFKAVELNI